MADNGTKPLHVVELRASNVKRIKAARVRPDGALFIVGGRNAQGKSSLLDAIEMALGGAKAIPPDPIRRGSRKAEIVVDLGEIVVERTFTAKGTQLVVKGADGVPVKSPQALLDSLCAAISFDPFAFSRMEPKKQDGVLKQVLGLDFGELDKDRAELFAARAEQNKAIKALEARLGAMPEPEAGLPPAEVSAADLLAEAERRQTVRAENAKARALVAELEQEHRGLGGDLAAIDKQIAKLEAEIAQLREDRETTATRRDGTAQRIEEERARVAALVDPDIDDVKRQLANIEETNRKVRSQAERAKIESELDERVSKAETMTEALATIDEEKQSRLAAASFPVPGLGFDELGPTLDGVPLEQASQAQKLRVSVAIGAALHPRLKVMLIREGSFLDSESTRLLAELADEHGLQCWIERVSEDGAGCSVVIEDGMVRAESASAEATG